MSTSAHFFRLIFKETLKEKRLRLPKKFIMNYGQTLSKDVSLELPCGSTWKMGLKNSVGCCGRVWMVEGWQEFANKYSLKRGHLLVFRYEGNSKFHVVICDVTTCEIDYSSNEPVHSDKPTNINRENRCPKRKETEQEDDAQSPSPSSWPDKRMRTCPYKTLERKGDEEKHATPGKRKVDILTGMQKLSTSEKARALERASGFKSKNPFFGIAMQPSYVLTSCLKIPTKFVRKYLKGKTRDVKLKVGKKTWPVSYSLGGCSTTNCPTPRFNNGWRKFSEDNNLDIGDVCVFVLVKDSAKVTFEVTIFRANENANPLLSPAHDGGRIPTSESHSYYDSGFRHETHAPGCSNFPAKQTRGHVSNPRTCLEPEGTRKPR